MPRLKITLLGAGSSYFAGVLGDLAITSGLAGSEITLYDLDLDKSRLMAGLGDRFAVQAGTGLCVRACECLADAVDGASFAISSIGGSGASLGGVHGTPAHSADMIIPARYGIFQIVGDTGGPAGMMMGLRSIPAYLAICREMERRCPDAILLNHSNPMAVLCRAMRKYTSINAIGICHGVQGGTQRLAQLMSVAPEELEVQWIGTNHYYWFTRIRLHGRDIYAEVMQKAAARTPPHGEVMSELLSQIYGYRLTYHDDAHEIEFYPFLAQVRDVTEMPYGYNGAIAQGYADLHEGPRPSPSHAEKEALREKQITQFAEELDTRHLPKRAQSAVRSEGIASLVEAIATGRREIRPLNLPNDGVVSNLPAHAILEVEAVTDSCGARGIQVGEAPLALMGLLQKHIAWQEMVVDAGVKGDRQLALQALMLDEMAIAPEKAITMLDELIAASQDLLPQFAPGPEARLAPGLASR